MRLRRKSSRTHTACPSAGWPGVTPLPGKTGRPRGAEHGRGWRVWILPSPSSPPVSSASLGGSSLSVGRGHLECRAMSKTAACN